MLQKNLTDVGTDNIINHLLTKDYWSKCLPIYARYPTQTWQKTKQQAILQFYHKNILKPSDFEFKDDLENNKENNLCL